MGVPPEALVPLQCEYWHPFSCVVLAEAMVSTLLLFLGWLHLLPCDTAIPKAALLCHREEHFVKKHAKSDVS